jgi:hypothetical protein
MFWQNGIFLLDFGHVLTVWYFSIRFWTCSDSMVFFYILSEHVQNLIEKYHTVRTCPKSNRKIVESGKIDTPNTQLHDHSIFCIKICRKYMVFPSKHKLNTNYLHPSTNWTLINSIKVTRGEIWVHNTSLTLPLFFKVPVPWQKMEWSCSCVLGVSILPLSTILSEHVQNLIEKYHSVRTCPKSNRKIPYCQNMSKI